MASRPDTTSRDSEVLQLLGLILVFLGFFALVGWALFSYAYSMFDPTTEDVAAMRDATIAVSIQMQIKIGRPERIVPVRGYSAEVYVTRSAFETVPYPDRKQLVADIGEAWCAAIPTLKFFPSLTIRDVRDGDTMGRYICFVGWVSSWE